MTLHLKWLREGYERLDLAIFTAYYCVPTLTSTYMDILATFGHHVRAAGIVLSLMAVSNQFWADIAITPVKKKG